MIKILLLLLLISPPSFSKNKIKLPDGVKFEEIQGARLYLKLPQTKKVKGVFFNIPYTEDTKHIKLVLTGKEAEKLLSDGWAIAAWFCDAQTKKIDIKGKHKDYGIHGNFLSPELKSFRQKRWTPWIQKIDKLILETSVKYELPTENYILRCSCISGYTASRHIDAHPEKYKAVIANVSNGLFEVNDKSQHIIVHLKTPLHHKKNYSFISSAESFQTLRTTHKPLIFAQKVNSKNLTDFNVGEYEFLKYLLAKIEKYNHLGNTKKINQAVYRSVLKDINSSTYKYDFKGHKLIGSVEASLIPKWFVTSLPNEKLYTAWKKEL